MGNLTLGIDIGGTNFRLGAVDEEGNISHFEKNSSRVFDAGDVVEIIHKEIEDYMDRYGIRDSVRAAAVGIPSIVSKDKKTIISTPNLKGFNNIRFSDKLQERHCSFKITDKEKIGIVGENGTGKSTILKPCSVFMSEPVSEMPSASTASSMPARTVRQASLDTFLFMMLMRNVPAAISAARKQDARARDLNTLRKGISPMFR